MIRMRQSLKNPIPELFQAWENMCAATDAHLLGDRETANRLFEKANDPKLVNWLYPEWEKCGLNVIIKSPAGDSLMASKAERDPHRHCSKTLKELLILRDGYRCRYCGIPVVSKEVRAIANRLYPDSVPWDRSEPRKRHQGFQALWLQFDHVVPHSHGGKSDEINSVVSCALCNFGKDKYTLRQLGLSDPRDRPPVQTTWDGLKKLQNQRMGQLEAIESEPQTRPRTDTLASDDTRWFFIPGAWISAGYVFTPKIDGKERWFKISSLIDAEVGEQGNVKGCRIKCPIRILLRRGITPDCLKAD